MIPGFSYRRRFSDLSEKEILALAISSEEDDASIYRNYAESLNKDYPDTAKIFLEVFCFAYTKHHLSLFFISQFNYNIVLFL